MRKGEMMKDENISGIRDDGVSGDEDVVSVKNRR